MDAFVDVQVNGLRGIDFSSGSLTAEDVSSVVASLRERGTIAFCPTVVTSSLEDIRHALSVIAGAMDEPDTGGHILGIHLEGPFISSAPGASGAHRKQFILPPSRDLFDQMFQWARGRISILTLAPETPGAIDLIRHCCDCGVVPALGHHLATDEQLQAAVDAGAACSTHLGNALPNQIHRHANPLWYQLACDQLVGSFITDGHHLPPTLIKVALRAKGVDRFIVTSDAARLALMPPGTYEHRGGQVVIEPSGRIFNPATDSLAASSSTMLECMNRLASLGLLNEDELWRVGRDNALRLLGLTPDRLTGLSGASARFANGRFVLGH